MNKFQTQISCCDRLDSELTVWLNIKLNIVLICLPVCLSGWLRRLWSDLREILLLGFIPRK